LDTIIDDGKWLITKDVEELWGVFYKIIKEVVLTKWRKEFLDIDETM
jgi:hypothetical protein